jgi:hypothetical protein
VVTSDFIRYLHEKILEVRHKEEPKGIKLNNRCTIATILFADDQILLAETENDLQRNLNHLNGILKEYNMKISTEKTKVVATPGRHTVRTKIVIDDEKIEQVSKFKYLGCNISAYGINEGLVENVQKYNKLNECMRRHFGKNVRQDLQLMLHKITSKPGLNYGSETWVLIAIAGDGWKQHECVSSGKFLESH